jgi:hypothetical protein
MDDEDDYDESGEEEDDGDLKPAAIPTGEGDQEIPDDDEDDDDEGDY